MTLPRPLQKILFGSPGTGKSYQIRAIATEQLGIPLDPASKTLAHTVKTVFHPEYSHADFIGKLLPQTQGGNITYKFYPGHFLQVLGMAYRSLMELENNHYLLVIDELNRGNASAIFGPVFQLLDRDENYWSSYEVDVSDLELMALFNLMGYKTQLDPGGVIRVEHGSRSTDVFSEFFDKKKREFGQIDYDADSYQNAKTAARLAALLSKGKIGIPPNLSILATINTSDESIYYLDSAFKRRWDWEYVESPTDRLSAPEAIKYVVLSLSQGDSILWVDCIIGINQLILNNSKNIRRIEDKQIGWWFIKPEEGEISLQQVRDKLMFYLWDSVFVKDRRPLQELLSNELNDPDLRIILFSDFVRHVETLMRSFGGVFKRKYWDADF
jgi:5-methylcytosine-specific restriction enzyme B